MVIGTYLWWGNTYQTMFPLALYRGPQGQPDTAELFLNPDGMLGIAVRRFSDENEVDRELPQHSNALRWPLAEGPCEVDTAALARALNPDGALRKAFVLVLAGMMPTHKGTSAAGIEAYHQIAQRLPTFRTQRSVEECRKWMSKGGLMAPWDHTPEDTASDEDFDAERSDAANEDGVVLYGARPSTVLVEMIQHAAMAASRPPLASDPDRLLEQQFGELPPWALAAARTGLPQAATAAAGLLRAAEAIAGARVAEASNTAE